jgi:hypothetical protein
MFSNNLDEWLEEQPFFVQLAVTLPILVGSFAGLFFVLCYFSV